MYVCTYVETLMLLVSLQWQRNSLLNSSCDAEICCVQVWLADWPLNNNPNKPTVMNVNVAEP